MIYIGRSAKTAIFIALTLVLAAMLVVFQWGVPPLRMSRPELIICLVVILMSAVIWIAHWFTSSRETGGEARPGNWRVLAVMVFMFLVILVCLGINLVTGYREGSHSLGFTVFTTAAIVLVIPLLAYFGFALIARREVL